jgi:hypothetical protein
MENNEQPEWTLEDQKLIDYFESLDSGRRNFGTGEQVVSVRSRPK